MRFLDFLKSNIVVFDGGMGTLLQNQGLHPGEFPETWNISHPDVIRNIHREYLDAGSNVVSTNTFGANVLKFNEKELENIIRAAIENARAALADSTSKKEKFVALDIGPLGKLLKPYGDLDFEDAVFAFAKTVSLGEKYGADLVIVETMNDSYETKAALLAVKENSSLPVIVSNAYGEDGKLMTGASPSAMVAMLEGMGADAIGVNCSLGPRQLSAVVDEYLKFSSVPVILQPNAGLPKNDKGKTVFDISAEEFADEVCIAVKKGVRIVGGCCGTTPEYIRKLSESISDCMPVAVEEKCLSLVSSYTHSVVIGNEPILIGERINPTGKKLLKQALRDNDIDYILNQAISQQESGAHILDVNVGLPEIDEASMLKMTVCEVQAVCDLPLQIDTSSSVAMETALRRYNGKAMINSVNGKSDSMDSIFPIAKKYGGLVVALTLDENGIPSDVEGRVNIAKRILSVAEKYGIKKKDIVFDTLTMPVSADKNAAFVTLESLRRIKEELGCNTVLGVSNVSFGLPDRDSVNSTFFAMALANGLSAAIMNPSSYDMMRTYYTYRTLNGYDDNCADYIKFANTTVKETIAPVAIKRGEETVRSDLQLAIIKGLREQAARITSEILDTLEPLGVVEKEIIPALNVVGEGFENKTVFLPQLLMSAEAAKAAFDTIKASIPKCDSATKKGTIVLATVEGDIHDIGKNIVRLLLENYGYNVIDLGKDVSPEVVLHAVVQNSAPLVGLSALMTTTVPAMEKTVLLIHEKAPFCKVIVGGAVLTKEYAERIGSDSYAKDAMETVRYAEKLFKKM